MSPTPPPPPPSMEDVLSNIKQGAVVATDIEIWRNYAHDDTNMEAIIMALTTLFEEGKYADKDMSQAFAFLKQAAENGNIEAQYKIGKYYEEGLVGVVRKDCEMACHFYQLAANNEHANAQYNLDVCGVVKEDVKWYRKEAADPPAFLSTVPGADIGRCIRALASTFGNIDSFRIAVNTWQSADVRLMILQKKYYSC